MVLQKYEIKNGQWYIQNIGIKQAFRLSGIPLDIEKAESWFTQVVQSNSKLTSQKIDVQTPQPDNLNQSTTKKLKTAFLTIPQFEHLYIDRDFRLIKTQREAKQRSSYTIAVRRQS